VKAILLTAAVLGAPMAAAAGPAPAKTVAPPSETTTVEELSVQPSASCLQPRKDIQAPAPKVVSTFPANGAVVRPGVLVLRVTFDQPMSCKGFFAAAAQLRSPCPEDTQYWVLSFDRRTIRTVCRTALGGHYGVRISDQSLREDSRTTFVSLAGKRLAPYVLTFDTSSEAPINTAGDSLEQDLEMLPKPPEFTPLKVQGLHFKP
jgi:hypothetical protein